MFMVKFMVMQVMQVYDIFMREMNVTLWCSGMRRLPTVSK